MGRYIREHLGKAKGLARARRWLLGFMTPAFAVCLAVGMFLIGPFTTAFTSYADTANPLINSNIGKHGEWYYGLTKTSTSSANWQADVNGNYMDGNKAGKAWTDTKKSSWMSQIGLDGVEQATYNGVTFNMTQRDHKLVQSEPYKDEKGVEKVFTIDSPEDAARVWTEAIAFALGESKDSPFKGEDYQDKSKDLLTGEVQKLADGSVAQGNYFAGSYQINDEGVPYSNKAGKEDGGQWTYKGTYITIKLNCDWYAKPIQTNILFTPENFYSEATTTPAAYQSMLDTKLNLWTTTFNWTDSEASYKEYWNETRRGYSDGTVVYYGKSGDGVNEEGKQNADLSKNSRKEQIADAAFKDGYKSTGVDGLVNTYYASYDLCINSDDKTYTLDEDSYTLKDGKYTKSAEGTDEGATSFPSVISENVTSPFSFGRINVPTGVYIVLDLNGHTISRDLADDDYDEIQHHGSILKERYEYPLGVIQNDAQAWVDGKEQSLKNTTMYGNPYCYYGNVIEVQPKARLEVVDSTAYERASDGRITKLNKDNENVDLAETENKTVTHYETNHKGTIMGGCADQKYVSYVDPGIDANGWSTGTKLMAAENAKATADVVQDGVTTKGNEDTFRVGSAYATWGYVNNEGKGGCIHAEARSEFILHSGTLTNSQAEYGGAIYLISNAAMIFYNGYILGNYASLYGGGIYLASASRAVFTVYDGVVSYNRAAGYGGGIALRDTAYVGIHDGDITYNVAGSYGGGIHIGPSSQGLLENATIRFNTAGIYGGGIYVDAQTQSFEFAGALIVTDNTGSAAKAYYHRDFTYTDYTYIDDYSTKHEGVHLYEHSDNKNTIYHVSFYPCCTNLSVDRADYGVKGKKGGSRNAKVAKGDAKSEYADLKRSDGTNANDYTYGSGRAAELNLIGGVIWKSQEDEKTNPKTANNLFLANDGTHHAMIVVGDSLFQNGINARIGITLQDVTAEVWKNGFTTNYDDKENVDPNRYFTSDDPAYHVAWSDNKQASGGTGESMLTTENATRMTPLYWKITGTLYGGHTFTIYADGTAEHGTFESGQHIFTWDDAKISERTGSTPIPSFLWTTSQLRFDHKMFEVTEVAAYDSKDYNTNPVQEWEIAGLSDETGDKSYSFHYLLENQGTESKPENALVYAGDYSFRVNKGNYSNTSFTITINQLGVAVSAYEVKDGKETWRATTNPFEKGKIPTPTEIETYLEGALYYRGTPYDFVLDKAYTANKDGEYDGFTGAVMKFTYANTDFFGTGVEVDFEKVDFGLEYYWRELTDNSQKELEKTNYFLHAGYYEVRGAHEVDAKGETITGGVDYMKNNIAFQSEMHLPIQRVSVSVWLEENATVHKSGGETVYGYTFKDGVYTTKQILYFNNNDEAGNDPELDKNVVVKYYQFDDYLNHIADLSKAKEVGIMDDSDGTERWGVKDAGKYVVHVSLNTQLWIEGDTGKGDFTERGKPYNDYIFTSRETQRMAEETTKDEQGHDVAYEFAYYFFIQPAVIESWEENPDPKEKGAGYLSLEDRTYDATDTEPTIQGKMKSKTEENAYYRFDPFAGDTSGVYVRYLSKKDYPTLNDITVTADDIEKNDGKWKIWDEGSEYSGTDANGNPILTSKFQPTDAGDYWILVYFRGVMPTDANKGSKKGDTAADDTQTQSYIPVTNFKGVYIGTYKIKPVEITVSASLSYTYDGSNFERARYLAPKAGTDYNFPWYESIFFLVQDNETTSNDLLNHQHDDTFMEGEKDRLDDLWGGTDVDTKRYKSRFTLTTPSVSYSDTGFMENKLSLGIGLYSFNTGNADQGSYHLQNVDYDNKKDEDKNGGTLTAPQAGVTWLITYGAKGAPTKDQTQAFNTSQNFVIKEDSWLNVTINQKNLNELAGDITKVGIDSFKHWSSTIEGGETTLSLGEGGNVKTGISYPFAGNNWKYEPGVTISYQPFYYATSMPTMANGKSKPGTGKTAYGTALSLTADTGAGAGTGDYTISYMNNSSASTEGNPARITLNGQGNYTGSLTLDFTITPAQIAVQYAGVGAVPQYDKTAHGVNVTYTNAETDDAYSKYLNADPKILVGSGDFTKPQPDASVYSITYKARTRTAGGFGTAALAKDITDGTVPIDAGVYDVKIVLGSNDYQFVSGRGDGSYFTPVSVSGGYSNTATGSHTILPAVVSYKFANNNEIYNRAAHTPTLTFTNITYEKNSGLRGYANIVPQLGSEYTVTINGKESEIDAGSYTVKVQLSSHNYCFALTVTEDASKKFITGYKDGSTGEDNYPSCETTNNYNYTVRVGSNTYPTNGSWSAPGNFVIQKATITLGQFRDSVYNRAAQPQTPVFTNTEHNNEAVPTHNGQNAGVDVPEDEFKVEYIDNNVITSKEKDSLNGGDLPFFAELYSVKITLTDAGAKNFRFETKTIPEPDFKHGEKSKAQADLLKQQVSENNGVAASIITAPFLINRVDITVTQLFTTDVYNAQDHFATGTSAGSEGIALTNWVSEMFQYSSSEAIQADDLTVDVIFMRNDGASATVHYTPTGTGDTVEYNGKKDYTFEEFAKQGFFTHVANYTVTVKFSEESFYITTSGAKNNNLELGFEYTITPAQITFSLIPTSFTYDAESHQLTYQKDGDGASGIILTNSANPDVLPTLEAEDLRTKVTVAYVYTGWAGEAPKEGKTVEEVSDNFKNVGTYTITITLSTGGDFQFADGNYELSRDYAITALDISKAAGNFNAAVFAQDTTAGHTDYKIPAYHYTGAEIKPVITLTDAKNYGITLATTDADDGKVGMSVAYTENVNAGKATATLTGIHNFTGTRTETFYVLPAIVSVTASDGNKDHDSTFNPNEADELTGGPLTFSYNKTLQSVTFSFANLCGSESVLPNNADYTVKYYKAEDWDTANNKPKAEATALDAAGVTNSGTYYVWIKFKSGTKEFSNFVFYKEDGAKEVENMFDKSNDHLFAYGFKVTVEKAQIEVYLSAQFMKTAESTHSFNKSFGYDRSDWQTRLNPVTFKNELRNGVIPINTDYQVTFLKDKNSTDSVVNAGSYTLKFELIGADKDNFVITHVRAGAAPDTTGASGNYAELTKGTDYTTSDSPDVRSFDVAFNITPAEITIHLAKEFVGSDEFINNFVYTRANRYSALSVISIKNAGNILPTGSDYTVSFKTELTGEDTTAVADVGEYYLIFKLNGDAATNYNVTAIYAGDGTVSVPVASTAEDKGYHGSMKDFSVKFDITPAQIEVYLSEAFRSEKTFVNSFGFNKNDWTNTLNGVQFKNELRNGIFPQNGEYTAAIERVGKDGDGTVKNVGTYKLVITLVSDGAKNFEIVKVYAGTPSNTLGEVSNAVELSENKDTGYEKTAEPFTAFSVQFKITPAEIQVHVPEQFRSAEGAFVNEFGFNKSSWASVLNAVTLSGKDDIVPTNSEYTVTFMLKDSDTVDSATDVGDYRLVFTLTDDAGNYVITAIYAGTDDTFDLCKKAEGTDAYKPLEGKLDDGTLKKFSLAFKVTPAEIDLYLNGFISGSAFANSFVYDGTNQSSKLSSVDFFNEGNITPSQGYSVTFYYDNVAEHAGAQAKNNEVFDAGKYFLHFELLAEGGVNKNYVLRDVYAGSRNGSSVQLTSPQYRDKTNTGVYVDFELTPSKINVFFSSSDLMKDGKYVNEFFYDRSDWTNRFGMVVFDTVTPNVGTTPTNSQYSIEYYGGKLIDGKEDWGDRATTLSSITDVGRYSVTFRLSNSETGHYPGAQHYNNYEIVGVYAGGASTETGKSVKLSSIDLTETPTGKDGYRTSQNEKDDVYVTLVFDITPAPIAIHLADGFKSGSDFVNSFVYNTSNRALTLNSSTITGTTTPNSDAYSFYFAANATAGKENELSSVVNVGTYYLIFHLDDEKGNFKVTGIYAGSDTAVSVPNATDVDGEGYYSTETIESGNLKSFSVRFDIVAAQIDVYLPSFYDGGLKTAFDYDRLPWAARLSQIDFRGLNGDKTIPTNADYTIAIKTSLEAGEVTDATNAGGYYFVFTLSSINFKIVNVYAGTTSESAHVKIDPIKETNTDFNFAFTINKAQIEVYLSEEFRNDTAFKNEFGFNKNDWMNTLGAVQFKNVLRNGIFPESSEYSASFKLITEGGEDNAPAVKNVGTYKLVLTLTNNKENFEIVKVFAGAPDGTNATVTANADKGYEKIGGDPMRSFSVKFTIIPAEIQVRVPAQFVSDGAFFNRFTYNKSNWTTTLNSVTLSGLNGIVPEAGEYTVTFEQANAAGTAISDVTNVGDYKLVFTLTDDAGNYIITAIYAGVAIEGEEFDVCAKAGSAYEARVSTIEDKNLKEFSLAFSIIPAELDLYLNAFLKDGAFTNEFVYDGTDQSTKLGIIEFKQAQSIVPIPEAYSVTFLYNIKDHYKGDEAAKANEAVYDVGKYTLYFRFTDAAGGNYIIKDVYAGTTSSAEGAIQLNTDNWFLKEDTQLKVNFELTPSEIDVYFSAGELKDGSNYKNEFYYDRSDLMKRFGSIYLDAVSGGAVPQGSQYSVEYYKATSVSDTKEEWDRDNPVKAIYNVGRYSVTFRLSNSKTGHYPGAKHYNNFTIRNVYAGGTKTDDSVELHEIDLERNPTDTNGYRKAVLNENNVYVTLVFEVKPNVISLSDVSDVIFNDEAQDAGYSFEIVDGQGAVLPELARKDFTANYSINEALKTGNERLEDEKPYFAGAYTVALKLSENFIFASDGRAAGDDDYTATRNFRVTPVVLSPFLGYQEGSEIKKGESLVYDGAAHQYMVYTEEVSVKLRDVRNEEFGVKGNVYAVREASYTGWAEKKNKWRDYTNAGTYTVTLKFYIFDTDGKPTEKLGGNFSFGSDSYSISLTYAITPRTIGIDDVYLADGETLAEVSPQKYYTGKPQTDQFRVLIALTAGAQKTELVRTTGTTSGDYSISNTPDINVGDVDAIVTGMNNYQGTVNLSYEILPAVVNATIDKASLPYNAQDQSRSFTFENKSGTGILPAYNANPNISDYIITYTYGGKEVDAPHNAGEYTVTVTLQNSTGTNGNEPNFIFPESTHTATFTFTVTKAEIYLDVIPGASYTGEARNAKIVFVNAANPSVVPKDYTVTYDGEETAPTHVKTDGDSRNPAPYVVHVLLKDVDSEATGAKRDLSNFKFITGGSTSYHYDETGGTWGEENYVITPAIITGTLSVTIDSAAADVTSNDYNAKKHNVSVVFRNFEAGIDVIPDGTMGEAAIEGLVATYEVKDGETLLYTFKVAFTPSWVGFNTMEFDGIPENAGSYVISVDLVSADFSFATSVSHADWTYTIANAKIAAAESLGTATEGTSTFTSKTEYVFVPNKTNDITVTAENFVFIDNTEGFNAGHATFTFTSCTGAGDYEPLTNGDGLTIGYKLTGAGTYTISITVDAPNHERWAIKLIVTVDATQIKLTVKDAHFEAVYGDTGAYDPANVLEKVLQFIRDGKILVEGISGTAEEQAKALQEYGFGIRILTASDDYSGAHLLKAKGYGLEIDAMEVSGFNGGNFVVFDNGSTEHEGTVFTVTPLAIVVTTEAGLADMHYNGGSLVNEAASFVTISNIFAGDDVFFNSIRSNTSEGGNFRGSLFEKGEAVHVGSYWLHVFTESYLGGNGLLGKDCANYSIETKDSESTTIRYNGQDGVYVAFEIQRRTVELAIADSTSVYGDAEAVYGTDGAKRFNISYNDSVLTRDYGAGEKEVLLRNFMLDLLALFDESGTTKLDRGTQPYPGAGKYTVKLDPDAGKNADGTFADWVLLDEKFNFEGDFILHIADDIQRGTHTVTKREMRVNVHDYTTFYGEELVESGFEGTEGSWGFDPLDDFVEGDSAKDLRITIVRDGAAFSGSGLSPTEADHWPAHFYANGLKATFMSANYAVKFSEGNYIIRPRPILVLIKQQSSVFGEPRVTNLTGASAWEVYYESSELNMDLAKGEGRSDLAITLTIGDVINQNAAAGVYSDVIKGSCANPNYSVTFRNWTTKDGANVPGEYEGGEYEITKRKVVIFIDRAEAVYGTQDIKAGMKIDLTAPVYAATGDTPTNAAQWSYDFDASKYRILPEHLSYLTFYLGKAQPNSPDEKYAVVGTHPIVGVWGYGYDGDMIFMKSYDVQFTGSWEEAGENYKKAGVFTVKPADITQRRAAEWEENRVYRQVNDETDRSEQAGWYKMAIKPEYLIYAGDYTVASQGKLTYNAAKSGEDNLVYDVQFEGKVVATVTYARPRNVMTGGEYDIDTVDDLWTVHSVGIWEMQVTVEAANHITAHFTLTYHIDSVTAKVMLNTSIAAMESEYGEYEYIALAPGAAYSYEQLQDLPLTEALHGYLASSIMGVDGLSEAYPGTSSLDWITMILDNCWVEVVNAKISSAGKLEAGRYHLRIMAASGCGFNVTFMDGTPDDGQVDFSGYDRLIINQKELEIDWVNSQRELHLHEEAPEVTEDTVTYTYSSYEYDYKPLFTQVLELDKVNAPEVRFYDNANAVCTPHDVGSYRITIEKALMGEDAGNYKLPEKLEIALEIVPMEVVVTLRDRSVTYGDAHPALTDLVPTVEEGVVESTAGAAWYCDKLGVNDGISALGLKIEILDGADAPIERQSNAGVYRIVGSSDSKNYHVTFCAETDSEKTEAVYTVYRRSITFKIDSLEETYGSARAEFTYERTGGSLAPWDAQIAAVGVSLSASCGDKRNAGVYAIYGTWTNTNYNVLFKGDWEGELPADYLRQDGLGNPTELPQGAGTYVINQLHIKLTMQPTMESIYGNYSFSEGMGVPTFYEFALSTVKPVTGYDYAYEETAANLKLTWTLPEVDKVGVYTIKAAEVKDEDPNYDIDFGDNVLVWTVTPREVTITVHTQHSAYGDALVKLDGSDLAFWTAENLAPWHKANAAGALGIELFYDGVTDRSNAGTYKNVIQATPTLNTDNYTFVYHNDEGETAFGTYEVDRRTVHLTMQALNTSIYGDVSMDGTMGTKKFETELRATFALAEGSSLAFDEEIEVLKIAFRNLPTKNDAGVYVGIEAYDGNDTNYEIIFDNTATWEVTKRTVTVTVHTQHSAYGDPLAELDGSDLAFWNAENLAPWHTDAVDALGIELSYNDMVLNAHSNAETYKNAIQATPTLNTDNYTFVYHNDEGETVYGTYIVDQRTVHLTMQAENTSIYGNVSMDGTPGTATFEAELRATFAFAEGSRRTAFEETIADLKIAFRNLPTKNDVGLYTGIEAYDNDTNYEIIFDNTATWEVTKRTVTITVYTQHSAYGDPLAELDGSDLAFWGVENLAPWHTDAADALGIELWIDGVTDRSNAGVYGGAIHAEAKKNTENYTFIYQNEDAKEGYGTYIVDPREITLEIGDDFACTFGIFYEEEEFNEFIFTEFTENGYTLAEGSRSLASWDADNADFVLGGIAFEKEEGFHFGTYFISGRDTDDNDNYKVNFIKGIFKINQAHNDWVTHFSLESMDEGDTPDAALVSASAKFGSATVKYYYDVLCLEEVTDELSALPKNTYYAKITVDETLDYTGLEEVKAFAVNESFLVVNGALDVTLYVCIYASQFIILTFAVIFIRRRNTDEQAEEMK